MSTLNETPLSARYLDAMTSAGWEVSEDSEGYLSASQLVTVLDFLTNSDKDGTV